jgi:DNA-binding XRE family transcriptional regulator
MDETVGQIMQARLEEVRKTAAELNDARASLVFWEVKLRLAAVAAAAAQVPKSQIAEVAGVSRPTLYGWLNGEQTRKVVEELPDPWNGA